MSSLLSLSLLACGAAHRGDADTAPARTQDTQVQVLFDQALQPALLAAIEDATERVDVAQYTLYDSGSVTVLVDALIAAASRGVPVRVLADEVADDSQETLDRLAAGGVETRLDSPATTSHNKLVIADDQAYVGSHNWSSHAMDQNHEGSVRLTGSDVAGFYRAVFESLWADSSGAIELAWGGGGPVTPLVNRQVAPALLDCIDGALERVRLGLYAFAYDDRYPDSHPALLVDALVASRGRGVDVQVLLDGSDWIVDNDINTAAIAQLEAGDVPVQRTPSTVTTHAKALVCDDTVVISDANWSYSSLDLYNGTSAQLEDASAVTETLAWWDGLPREG